MAALGTTMREQVFSNLASMHISSPSQKPRLSILAFSETWPSGMNMQVTFFSFMPPVGDWWLMEKQKLSTCTNCYIHEGGCPKWTRNYWWKWMIRTSASKIWISPTRSEEMIYGLKLICFDISLIKVINMRNSPASLECWHPRALQLRSVSYTPEQVERVYPSKPSQSIEQTQTCPCRKTPAACWENDTCINLQKNMT